MYQFPPRLEKYIREISLVKDKYRKEYLIQQCKPNVDKLDVYQIVKLLKSNYNSDLELLVDNYKITIEKILDELEEFSLKYC